MRHPLREWALRTSERMDDPAAPARDVVASLHDLARINRAFGYAAAVAARSDDFLREFPAGSVMSVLDIGSGIGDIPRAVARRAARRGVKLVLVGLERLKLAARETTRLGGVTAIVGDGGQLPFRSGSFDLVLCTKVLHHLPGEPGRRLLAEMHRVARRGVIVSDLRRSLLAAAGYWLVSFPMRLHRATRHDGLISVFRGFNTRELQQACEAAGGRPVIRHHLLWCLSAAWRKNGA